MLAYNYLFDARVQTLHKQSGGVRKLRALRVKYLWLVVQAVGRNSTIYYAALPKELPIKVRSDVVKQAVELGFIQPNTILRGSTYTTAGYVYVLADGDYVKIGKSVDVKDRMKSLQTGNPREIILVAKKLVRDGYECESLLQEWAGSPIRGEWYMLSGSSRDKLVTLVSHMK